MAVDCFCVSGLWVSSSCPILAIVWSLIPSYCLRASSLIVWVVSVAIDISLVVWSFFYISFECLRFLGAFPYLCYCSFLSCDFPFGFAPFFY